MELKKQEKKLYNPEVFSSSRLVETKKQIMPLIKPDMKS